MNSFTLCEPLKFVTAISTFVYKSLRSCKLQTARTLELLTPVCSINFKNICSSDVVLSLPPNKYFILNCFDQRIRDKVLIVKKTSPKLCIHSINKKDLPKRRYIICIKVRLQWTVLWYHCLSYHNCYIFIDPLICMSGVLPFMPYNIYSFV